MMNDANQGRNGHMSLEKVEEGQVWAVEMGRII